jgi:hypothetical protein
VTPGRGRRNKRDLVARGPARPPTYAQAFATRRAPWSIAAAARAGQLYEHWPRWAPLAAAAFESCIASAKDLDWGDDWSRTCERELHRLRPRDYPLPSEIKPEAQYEPTMSMSLANVLEAPEEAFEKPKPATN